MDQDSNIFYEYLENKSIREKVKNGKELIKKELSLGVVL